MIRIEMLNMTILLDAVSEKFAVVSLAFYTCLLFPTVCLHMYIEQKMHTTVLL